MLKRLELVGFKSFADKTVFDFGDGVTAFVGPNGSGKSNIVDAVRWILGEQSARSLRGGEMADVIFNGSTSRRSLGMAEVTMTFSNHKRALATDSEEVQITRRVYRSGEGEYLMNGQVCRLRDIKELFLGTGAGADAYCIIEQGRVDVLLQASTQDRRTIFEEAAGISKFKAKKVETQRKLERVDQNLQRLRDIIDEVEKQLRSVKLQASKAQRYQEYSTRLKALRVGISTQEYHQLRGQLEAESVVLDQLKSALAEHAARMAGWETDMQRLEALLTQLEETLREQEGRLSQAREQIKASATTLSHESSLAAELDAELARGRSRVLDLTVRISHLTAAVAQARAELGQAETLAQQHREQVQRLEQSASEAVRILGELRGLVTTAKAQHLEQMRRAAHLHNDAVSFKAQVDNLARERERLRLKSEQAAENLASLDVELQELAQADAELQTRLQNARQALVDLRLERERLQHARDEATEALSGLRQQRSGLVSRVEVLQGLERSHEGLGTGVREVLEQLEQPEPGPWKTVLGMVADFLTVRREYAPLIDLALGDWAQRFLVRSADQLAEALTQRGRPFSGRVSFLPLQPQAEVGPDARHANRLIEVSFHGRVRMPHSPAGVPAHEGVVAAAETLVSCDHPELADLPAQLLGQTLLVRDLAAARTIAAHTSGYRLITLQGELLEPDGTLTVGAHHAEAGILSRKSELRDLRQQITALDERIAAAERDLAATREQLAALEPRDAGQQEQIAVLSEQAADLRARLEGHRDRRQGLHEEVSLSRDEIQRIAEEMEGLERSWTDARTQAAAAEAEVRSLQDRIERAEQEIRQREHDRQQHQQEINQAAVALAKVEERLAGLRSQHDQLAADLKERQQEAGHAEQALRDTKTRLAYSQLTMLNASASLAHWHREKELAEQKVAQLSAQRQEQRQERMRLAGQAQTARNEWRSQQEQTHARELAVSDLRHRQSTLVDRLREDYQIDLIEHYQQFLAAQPPAPAQGQDAVVPGLDVTATQADEQIAELRKKLAKLGSVNLESLQELAELETRAATLKTQFDDLTGAKRSLEEIIGKINQDSRRLFMETFASVREHFQELFRKLFGGGMADIVLEENTDILDSGIEIIARPPGKELRSISLMSGGEKTLTAVALLLAIFRSKPSPFCILDEVDAALDEANIGRFTAVLRDFLELSQFIIVTHSKKTMACADVLYGITMQESGISKRVSVRFEDWPDETPAQQTGNGIPQESFAGR
jgi:chromosome segregation protein